MLLLAFRIVIFKRQLFSSQFQFQSVCDYLLHSFHFPVCCAVREVFVHCAGTVSYHSSVTLLISGAVPWLKAHTTVIS